MTFTESVKSCLSGYAKFEGRASRSEYWWFGVFNFLAFCIYICHSPIYEKSEFFSPFFDFAF